MNKLITSETEDQPQPKLQLIEGGKDNENWLKDLPEGTVFLCQMIADRPTIDANEYHVKFHADEFTKLHSNLNTPINMWVNSLAFSRIMKLSKVLGNNGE